MEADWEVEVGGDAPVLEGDWAGLVDLRNHPERIGEVEEARILPELAGALMRLNSQESPIRTSKCDIWLTDGLDPYEMDAGADQVRDGVACYIDLHPGSGTQWETLDDVTGFSRTLAETLRGAGLSCCRVDLVIRRAFASGKEAMGVTAYLTGCGATPELARLRLGALLSIFADAVCESGQDAGKDSRLK